MPTLTEAARAVGIDFGFQWSQTYRSLYPGTTNVLATEGAYVAPGDWKGPSINPSSGVYNWTALDSFATWVESYDLRYTQGYCVGGNSGDGVTGGIPAYIQADTNPTTLRTKLENFVTGFVSHWGSRIETWMLCNEIIASWQGNPNGYRTNHYWTYLGDDYVKYALDAAAAASVPGQAFIWGDNHAIEDASPTAFDNVKAQLVRWLDAGVRIDGFGAQFHLNAGDTPTPSEAVDRLNQMAALGLDIYIFEFDITDTPYTGTADSIKQQCADYTLAMLGPICRDVPRLKHLTCWSPTDAASWLNSFLGARGDAIPRTGNPYDRSDPPQPNPMRQALLDAFALRPPIGVNAVLTPKPLPSVVILSKAVSAVLTDQNGAPIGEQSSLDDESAQPLTDQTDDLVGASHLEPFCDNDINPTDVATVTNGGPSASIALIAPEV